MTCMMREREAEQSEKRRAVISSDQLSYRRERGAALDMYEGERGRAIREKERIILDWPAMISSSSFSA